MILKKPYKFLIKHFRIIHIVLFLPILYLIIRMNKVYSVFNSYVHSSYSAENISNLAGSNINAFMYLATILIIGIAIAIYYLMKQKEKPTKLYISFILYYIILFISLTIFYNALTSMQTKDLASNVSRAYRDISLIISLPQYFFAFYSIFRGLGFDIKQFKFESDLKDLEISAEDNEEFEFVVGVETYKYKRSIRRFIREFRYYILENKFVFTCISVVVGLIIVTTLYMHFNVYNKSYTKNHNFAHNSFNINVTDSMLTTIDYNGNVINKDKYYLVLQIFISNISAVNMELDTDNFRLQVDDGYLVPKLDRSQYFVDFGASYNGEKIRSETSATYNLVYELNKKQVKRNYEIKILENIDYKIGDITAHYKILNIRPTIIYNVDKAKEYKLKEEVDLEESNLNDTTIKINDYEIVDNYYYSYESCESKDKCRTINDYVSSGLGSTKIAPTLLVLDLKTKIDKESVYGENLQNMSNFYEDFFKVEYDGVEVLTKNVTPSKLEGKVVLQLTDKVKTANNIKLVITIRNKKYEVILK